VVLWIIVFLSFLFWPLHCLLNSDLKLLITLLVSSNISDKWDTSHYSLGQLFVLHASDITSCPVQSAPPCCGAGLVHDRYRSWVPPPHVTEHLLHTDHLSQPPSTEIKRFTIKFEIHFNTFLQYFQRHVQQTNIFANFEYLPLPLPLPKKKTTTF